MYYYELLNVPPTNIFDIRHFFDIGHFIFQAKNFVGTADREEEERLLEEYSFLQCTFITENKLFL